MFNQPKRYKKFLATTATASLVASAMAPIAASATPTDITNNDHEQAILNLLELGYVTGKADGTFAPNEKITRGQVVLMLGKWAEDQGILVPDDYATKEYFTDYPTWLTDENKKYYALVKANGIFEGYADGSLNPNQTLSRVQLAVVLNSAYKAVTGKSFEELAGDTSEVIIEDIDSVYEDYRPAVLAMKKLGITSVNNFNPSASVTRGQFASFLNATITANTPIEANGIKSLTATGVSKLTVEFNAAVNPENVQFAVTRGTNSYTVSKVEWNEEHTAAVLTVDTAFNDATYTLTVTGISEEPTTATVTTTREQVTSIEFLSDYLVFTGREDDSLEARKTYKEAVITFAVYNQYGEDITKKVNDSYMKDRDIKGIDVYGDENDIEIKDGKFVVWVDEDEDDDATGSVEFTYEQNDVEIDVKHNVQLSDESEPAKIEIVGLYSPGDEELTVENLEDEVEFSILFKVKDQYGVEIDPKYAEDTKRNITTGDTTILEEVRDGISVSVTNDKIFDVEDPDDGTSGVNGLHGKDGIEVLNVDGEYYFAIDIMADDIREVEGGDNTVTFRAKATGEETSQVFTVIDSGEPYRIEIGFPDDIVAGGEDVKLPILAYDKHGELITSAKILNNDLKNEKIILDWDKDLTPYDPSITHQATIFTFVEEKGQIYLKFETKDNISDEAEKYDIDIEVDQTGIENSITLSVEPNAYPKSISSLKDKTFPHTFIGEVIEFDASDFVIEDQYGRKYINLSEGSAEDKDHTFYTVSIKPNDGTNQVFKVTDTEDGVEALRKGNATFEFKLTAFDLEGNKVEDTIDVTFRSYEIKDFDSFIVKSDGILYGSDEYSKVDNTSIKVNGVKGDLEIAIPSSEFNITTDSEYLNFNGNVVTADTAKIEAAGLLDDEDDTYEVKVSVTVNDTGDTMEHSLTLTREQAITTSFKLNDKFIHGKKAVEEIDLEYRDVTDEATNDYTLTINEIITELLEEGKFDVKDQYGNKPSNSGTGEVSFFDNTSENIQFVVTDINSDHDKGVISSNGSSNLTLKLGENGLTVGDSFNLILRLDDKSQTIKVYIR